MIIEHTSLPQNSILNNTIKRHDYIDSYKSTVSDPQNKITATALGKAFFSSSPKWVEKLFSLRNKLVSLIGLKTPVTVSDRQRQLDNFKCEKGEQLGLFKIFEKTTNEVLLGEDDKHLDFRVSLFLAPLKNDVLKKEITITTTVSFNNWLGPVYFLFVKPFHKIIVTNMLKGISYELEKKNL